MIETMAKSKRKSTSGKRKKSSGNLYGTKHDKESQGKAGQLYNDF